MNVTKLKTVNTYVRARIDTKTKERAHMLDARLMNNSAIPAEHIAMGDSKGGDRGSPPFGASKSVAFAQHRNKEAFPRFLAGMAVNNF
ncbi:MAG: hypothetical protein A3E85_05365 [Gammaproteobacteria bacterium RIFCSPHIGHO2_12_FULL_45_12]|nr:MAG: hypothetical protein A3E85_05365 [Gammaproteobacteria bacterium RIFCSPHIGHO2_12_FULL_45_12]